MIAAALATTVRTPVRRRSVTLRQLHQGHLGFLRVSIQAGPIKGNGAPPD